MADTKLFELATKVIEQLSSPSASVIPAITTAKSVANRLGDAEAERWLDCELRGYNSDHRGTAMTTLREYLQVPESSELPRRVAGYRTLRPTFFVQTSHGVESMPYLHFFTERMTTIEAMCAQSRIGEGRFRLTIPKAGIPPQFLTGLQNIGFRGDSLDLMINAEQLHGALSGFKAELLAYLSSAILRLPTEAVVLTTRSGGVVTGAIRAETVTIVNAGDQTSITVGPNAKLSGTIAIKQLREEVLGLQDLIIGSIKDHQAFQEHERLIKDSLLVIIDMMEKKVDNKSVDEPFLRAIAQEAISEVTGAKLVEPGILEQLVGNGVSQSLIASVIFEGIKKGLGIP